MSAKNLASAIARERKIAVQVCANPDQYDASMWHWAWRFLKQHGARA